MSGKSPQPTIYSTSSYFEKDEQVADMNTATMSSVFFRRQWDSVNDWENPNEDQNFVKLYKYWKLDEEVQEFRKENPDKYDFIVCKFDQWFYRHRAMVLYSFVNTYSLTDVDYDDFKRCLRDLGAPATEFELHIICLLFDLNNRKAISLKDLEVNVVARLMKRNDSDELAASSALEVHDKYVRLSLICEMLDTNTAFHGHLNVVVKTTLHVVSIADIIQEEVPLHARCFSFYLFAKHALCGESPLPLYCTLEALGLPGGPRTDPPLFRLYYNYEPKQYELCPLVRYVSHQTVKRVLKHYAGTQGEGTLYTRNALLNTLEKTLSFKGGSIYTDND